MEEGLSRHLTRDVSEPLGRRETRVEGAAGMRRGAGWMGGRRGSGREGSKEGRKQGRKGVRKK